MFIDKKFVHQQYDTIIAFPDSFYINEKILTFSKLYVL